MWTTFTDKVRQAFTDAADQYDILTSLHKEIGRELVKKNMRRSESNPQGAILSKEVPLPLDRVIPVCPRCNRGVRVGSKVLPDGSKSRICRRCGESF